MASTEEEKFSKIWKVTGYINTFSDQKYITIKIYNILAFIWVKLDNKRKDKIRIIAAEISLMRIAKHTWKDYTWNKDMQNSEM